MHRPSIHATATVAAALIGVAGLTASASAQQGSWQNDQYEMQRQREMQRQFERQQRQLQQQQMQQRQRSQMGMDARQLDPGEILVVGVDVDKDGLADLTYFVPANVVQQIDRQHTEQQQRGVRSMQLQPWNRIQQASGQMDEPSFEDLPITQAGGQMGQMQTAQIQGTITESRTAKLAGSSQPSKLLKIRTQDGRTVFADVGPERQLRNQDIQLSRGDQVMLSGQPAWINNQPVLFADRIRTQDSTASVQRASMGGSQGRQQQEQQVSGTINQIQYVTLGDSEPYAFASVETDQGRSVLVNLGPSSELQKLNISEGDQITVSATKTDLFGQEVHHAHQVRSNGQSVYIQQTSTPN